MLLLYLLDNFWVELFQTDVKILQKVVHSKCQHTALFIVRIGLILGAKLHHHREENGSSKGSNNLMLGQEHVQTSACSAWTTSNLPKFYL